MATGINLKEFAQLGHCQQTINIFPKQFNKFLAVGIIVSYQGNEEILFYWFSTVVND